MHSTKKSKTKKLLSRETLIKQKKQALLSEKRNLIERKGYQLSRYVKRNLTITHMNHKTIYSVNLLPLTMHTQRLPKTQVHLPKALTVRKQQCPFIKTKRHIKLLSNS